MKGKNVLTRAALLAAATILGLSAHADVMEYQTGFESNETSVRSPFQQYSYGVGPLDGDPNTNNGWVDTTAQAPTNAASVVVAPDAASVGRYTNFDPGTQSVRLTNNGTVAVSPTYGQWDSAQIPVLYPNVGSASSNFKVKVSWDMAVMPNTNASGPLFGVAAKANGVLVSTNPDTYVAPELATFGVDSANGRLMIRQPIPGDHSNNGPLADILGTSVSLSQWHHYDMVLDFATRTAQYQLDGAPVLDGTRNPLSTSFVEQAIDPQNLDSFGEGDLASLLTSDTVGEPGSAYFDNYQITSLPEPTAFGAILGMLGFGMFRRRSRDAR